MAEIRQSVMKMDTDGLLKRAEFLEWKLNQMPPGVEGSEEAWELLEVYKRLEARGRNLDGTLTPACLRHQWEASQR